MSTLSKDFKVKNGLQVTEGGTFGAPVTVGTPTGPDHATTKSYVDGIILIPGPTGPAAEFSVSETPPTSPVAGQIWFNPSTGSEFVFYDGFWIEVSGAMGATGPTGPAGVDGSTGIVSVTGPITDTGTSGSSIIGLDDTIPRLNANQTFTGLQTITPSAAANLALLVKGVASQSADLQQWQSSTAAVVAKIANNGALTSAAITANGNITAQGLALNSSAVAAIQGKYWGISYFAPTSQSVSILAKVPVSGVNDPFTVINASNVPIFQVSNAGKVYNSNPAVVPLRVTATPLTTFTINSIAGSGTVVTYTGNFGFNPFVVGQTVTITGATTTAYNITNAVVATVSGNTFTVASTATGATSTASAVSTTAQGSLQQWQDAAGSTLASITSNGLINATPYGSPATLNTASHLGYMGMPQISTSTNLTLSEQHSGKHIYSTVTGLSHGLPVGTQEIGTTIVFINPASVTTTITATGNTMYLAGVGTTGSRTLAPFGMATAVKIDEGTWIISGNGLT